MNEIILEIIYFSLTSVVPSTIAILVPLVGAFWIFKVREKTVAEGKIFEFGREIANILQAKEIKGPIDAISYVYIDNALHNISEKNRDKAIKEILREYLYFYKLGEEPLEEETRKAGNIVVAIATERVQSLVPPTVNWSGRGFMYSPFGVDIETKDNYFPFGTKLYRQWIERFGGIYNDLWAITNSRRSFIVRFLSNYKDSTIGIDEEFVTKWLNEIDDRIRSIRPIHARLLTQVQIIDTQIDLPRLGKNIGLIAFYMCLLACVGFFVPKILHLTGLLSLWGILSLAAATILSYALISIRAISGAQPEKEKNIQRKIFMPRLANELEAMKKKCMRYNPHIINDILSLDSDLRLGVNLKSTLVDLVNKIEVFNEYSGVLYKNMEEFIDSIKNEFVTKGEGTQGFCIEILDLANREFDLDYIKSRVMNEDYNFIFSYEEINYSHSIFTINLAELDGKKRLDLCERLEDFRGFKYNLSLYKTTKLALDELQNIRASALTKVQKLIKIQASGIS